MTPDQISLARAAVVAKVAYWDALRAFEIVTTDDSNEWNDRTNDRVHVDIEHVAACAGNTANDSECLTDENLEQYFGFLSNILTLGHSL